MKSILALNVLAIVVALSNEAAQAAVIYDAAADFSAVNNPTGVWSYGENTGNIAGVPNPTTFSVYTAERSGASIGAVYTGLDLWTTAPTATDPNVVKNTTAGFITDGNNHWSPGALTLGPAGSGLGGSVVEFTAPATTTYALNATFINSQTINTGAQVYVFDNSTQLDTFSMGNADLTSHSYSNLNLSLHAGDKIEFVVANGLKTTQLEATLTVVPEPTSAALAGFGAVGLLIAVRRQNRSIAARTAAAR